MPYPTIEIRLPDWIEPFLADRSTLFASAEERMRLVVELSAQNVESGGGPFGAAVFERHSGRLVAPGVNLVVPASCSAAHAEVVALSVAQRALATFDLGAEGLPEHELVASTEPCAQCFGALIWSGVRSLVCGARGEDAEAIGFDEGPKASSWVEELEQRGITVTRDVLREEAAQVLRDYARAGAPIYNGRRDSPDQ